MITLNTFTQDFSPTAEDLEFEIATNDWNLVDMPIDRIPVVHKAWKLLASRSEPDSGGAGTELPSANDNNPCERILKLTGPAVLLHVPHRTKRAVRDGWPEMTIEDMHPRYLAQLDENIGVSLGKASNGLCTIDCDGDEFFDIFLKTNPHLADTLQSHGARGGNVWVRIEGKYPPFANIVNMEGDDIGEWRGDNHFTVISGVHPSGIAYSTNEKPVLSIKYTDIKWPADWIHFFSGSKSKGIKKSKSATRSNDILDVDFKPVSPEKVEATLFKIPPRPGYKDWLRITASVRNSLGNDDNAIEMLNRWSPEEEEGEYYRLLNSSDFSEITFGTLDFYAKECGSSYQTGAALDDGDTPLFTDLSPYLDGTFKQEVPSVGLAYRDFYLLYAGRLNEIHSEPSVGKTNVAMAACNSVLEEGGLVLYIDPEDTPLGFATRMISLGASPDDIRDKVFYLHNPSQEQIYAAQKWAEGHHPNIVVLDGLAESMAAASLDENKAADVLGFFRTTLRPFAEAGAAVLIADHVTKNSDNRGQFARGSGAKAGRYDGVSYEIMSAVQYTPTQAGFVKLKIQKDRNGGAGPRGKIVAQLHFTPGANGHTITEFREPEYTEGRFRPTIYMDRIVEHLKLNGGASASDLRTLGKAQHVTQATNQLIREGTITCQMQGQAKHYRLVNRFRERACPPVPTLFPACSEQGDRPCSPVPPPLGGTGEQDPTTL